MYGNEYAIDIHIPLFKFCRSWCFVRLMYSTCLLHTFAISVKVSTWFFMPQLGSFQILTALTAHYLYWYFTSKLFLVLSMTLIGVYALRFLYFHLPLLQSNRYICEVDFPRLSAPPITLIPYS